MKKHFLFSALVCLLCVLGCKNKKPDPNKGRGIPVQGQTTKENPSALGSGDPSFDSDEAGEERRELENTPLELLVATEQGIAAEATAETDAAAKTQREAHIKAIQQSFQQQTPELFDCLRGEIHENTGSVTLSVSAKLSPAGRVTTASVSGIPSYLDRACVEGKARNMHVQNPVNEMVDVNAEWLFDLRAMPH